MKRGIAAAILGVSAVVAMAESDWMGEVFVGKAIVPFLGSEDPRTCWGFGLGMQTNPPGFLKVHNSKLIYTAYYMNSHSPGASGEPANTTNALGISTVLRIPTKKIDLPTQLYVDLGWGLNISSQRTVDLSSRLTSTPIIGLAVGFRQPEGREVVWGIRLMHLSNAGIEGNNQGQNQVQTYLQFRF